MEDNKSNIVLQAILWALLSSFASGIMVNLVRLASETVSIPQIIFVRNFFAFTIFIPFILYKGVNSIKTEKLNLHILRSITGVIAMMLFFYGISKMNLSLVTAISFTAPLIAAIFAYMAFNDKPGIHRIIALIIGFIGALIVIRPGFEDFDPLSLVVLLSAVFWAGSSILIKKLSNTDSAFSITFYMTIFMMVFTAPVCFFYWKELNLFELIIIFFIALTSNVLQYGLAKSLSLVDISVVLPVDFSRLIFTAVIAYFAFNETMDLAAAVGSAIIIGGAVYNAYRERKANKQKLFKKPPIEDKL